MRHDLTDYSKLFGYHYSVGIQQLYNNSHLESRRLDVWVSLTFLLVSKGLKANSKSRKRLLQITAGGTKFATHPPSRMFGWRLSITHLFGSAPRQESLFHGQVCFFFFRLRVVSNFGDCDCGAGKIHTRARESRRRDGKGAPKINFRRSLRVASPRTFARACVFCPPHNHNRQN